MLCTLNCTDIRQEKSHVSHRRYMPCLPRSFLMSEDRRSPTQTPRISTRFCLLHVTYNYKKIIIINRQFERRCNMSIWYSKPSETDPHRRLACTDCATIDATQPLSHLSVSGWLSGCFGLRTARSMPVSCHGDPIWNNVHSFCFVFSRKHTQKLYKWKVTAQCVIFTGRV